MADNGVGASARTSSSSTPPPDSSDHVNLRVIYLLTGNPRPPHPLGRVSLNTTVASLKDRIQSELPEHPSPQLQRLIYQGRPLLRNEATLRHVLRLEGGTPPGPLPYTIHIIVNSNQQPSPTPQPTATVHHPPPPVHNANPITVAQASAAGLQEALSRIQQSIETNGADLRSVQQRIAMQHHNLAALPTIQQNQNRHQTQPGPGPGPGTGPTFAFQANPPGFPMPLHLPQLPALPPNFIPGHANLPAVQAALDHHRQHLQQHGIPGWPPMAPHAPHLPGQINTNPTFHPANPSINPPAPGFTPSNPQIQSIQGPNGERMTVVTDHVSLRIPIQRPASAPGQTPERIQQTPTLAPTQQPTNLTLRAQHQPQSQPPPAPLPMPLPNLPFHLPMPFSHAHTAPNHSSSTAAWVLSSPAGPHALLFAPNHGYFSSTNFNTQVTHPDARSTNDQVTTSDPSQTVDSAQTPTTNTAVQRHGDADRALVRQGERAVPAVPALAQAPQNPQDNDLFAFLIQRGWLFLRLYLFMFVFSEPGTWKRWLMIILAAVICLQPRNGPLTRALTAARQHFDNLIGPAAPRPQPEPVAQRRPIQGGQRALEGDRTTQRPANVRGAIQMTPEEAAARLVREHQNQNPSVWRNTLHRVEQSVALFLASLIPGVGERHVRAREEARRLAQRLEEEERRRAEEVLAAQQDNNPSASGGELPSEGVTNLDAKVEGHSEGPSEPSTSSGVQVRDTTTETGELRNRTT
jgi:hypothetical protein